MIDFALKEPFFKRDTLSEGARVKRLRIVKVLALLWVTVIIYRLVSLQLTDFARWQDWAVKQHLTEFKLAPERGPIFDRQGKLLAFSVPASSVYARPLQIVNKNDQATKLAKILKIDRSLLLSKLNEQKPFVWLKRQIPRSIAEQINEMKIAGIGSVMESKRYYPQGEAASRLIGRVGIDGSGLSGLEQQYEKQLAAGEVATVFNRDALGNMIAKPVSLNKGSFEMPKGNALKLTIDAGLELIVEEELARGHADSKAKHVLGLLLDADSGEILALGQTPAVDFNAASIEADSMRNLIAETVFEPGSIIKPIVAAAALENQIVSPQEIIDCEGGHFYFGGRRINDVHPYDRISFSDVIVRSSNIGMTKIGERLGAQRIHQCMKDFGFGEQALTLPGESAGILRDIDRWSKVDVATHAFGQGIAVTSLQMVRAISAIANGGKLPRLKLIQDDSGLELKRIISERTASQVRAMMYGVVESEHGTGHNAAIGGIRVGGKTGTAQKARRDGRGYEEGAYVASFVGFADGAALGLKKTLTLMVVVDEPGGKSIYGGAVAAPIFKRIMSRAMHYLAMRNEIRAPEENGLLSASYAVQSPQAADL